MDGSRDKDIYYFLNNSDLEHYCLFEGQLSFDLASASPYVVELEKDNQKSWELFEKAWGNHWGVFVIGGKDYKLSTLRRNCRKIAYVKTSKNKKYIFRYFDPRILSTYLPTCDETEANQVFGEILEYITDANGTIQRFTRSTIGVIDQLKTEVSEEQLLKKHAKAKPFKILAIRDEQLKALSNRALEQDYQSIKVQFIEDFIDDQSKPIEVNNKAVPLDTFLRTCLNEAIKFEIEDQYAIYSFFHLNYTHGWQFWKNPNNQWALKILESKRKDDIRIEKLEEGFSQRLMDQIWSA